VLRSALEQYIHEMLNRCRLMEVSVVPVGQVPVKMPRQGVSAGQNDEAQWKVRVSAFIFLVVAQHLFKAIKVSAYMQIVCIILEEQKL